MALVLALAACGNSGSSSGSNATSSGGGSSTSASGSGSGGGSSASGGSSSGEKLTGGGGDLTFTTGGDQGTYYAFGGVMAAKVSEVSDTTVTAITSGGSQANIQAMEAGDADMGFVQSDVMSYAYDGTRLFEGAPVQSFSTVGAMYMEQVQIITLDPNIKTVADLEGKSVSIGDQGSGAYFNAIDVLGAYGLTEDDIKPQYLSFGDSTEAMQDGQIDAAFVVAGAPTPAVTSLAASKDVYLVSLDEEHIAQLQEDSPYYSTNVISKDAYGTEEDCTTVAVSAVVIANDSVSEGDVYNFIAGVFNNLDNLSHDKAKELSLEHATSITNIPYHPGAVKYFAEQGIEVPSK